MIRAAGVVLVAGAALFTVPNLPARDDPREMLLQARARAVEVERIHGAASLETGAALERLAAALLPFPQEGLAEGTASARRALEIREAYLGSEHPDIAGTLELLAMWQWYGGEYEAVRVTAARALALRERAVPPEEACIARNLHFLSDSYRVDGDYGRALQLRGRIGPLVARAHGPESDDMAVHLHALAQLEELVGDRDRAVIHATESVAIREKILPATDLRLARSLNLLGRLLVDAGELPRAEALLEQARTIWETSGNAAPADAANALTSLGELATARGDHARAVQLYAHAAAIRSEAFGADHPLVAWTFARLGGAQRQQGDGRAASASLRRALEIQKSSSLRSYPEWAATLREQALLDAGEGRLDAALQGALKAEQMLRDHFRASALGLSERENLARSRARVRDFALAWSWASDLAGRGALSEETAFRLVDEAIRSRALVLDTLATRQRVLALHRDAQTAAAVDTLRLARARLTRLLLEGSTDEVAEAQAEADAAERALAEKSRDYRHERDRGFPGLLEVREKLPQESALLSYFVSDRGYVASIVRPGAAARIVPLGDKATIDEAVLAWSDAVGRDPRPRGAAVGEAAYLRVARDLAEMIWDPVTPFLQEVGRVFIVPDGMLHAVNLATLVTARGDFLVESSMSFHYLTAERDLVRDEIEERGRRLLALGDPAYGDPFAPLPGSRSEVLEIASRWQPETGTRVLLGGEASETAFKELAPSFGTLHLAVHATFGTAEGENESPLRVAGLVLATPAPRGEEDGILTVEEIALLDLRAVGWVVLSACATGRGLLEPGEGVLGLRRAFQIAGAGTLVVSLWPVEDDATRHWMGALYDARRAGGSTVDAARRASLGVLEEQRRIGGTTHPYFWGGFVTIGDWR